MDDNHKLTNRGGIHQLQKSKREFDFFLSCALSGYEAIIRWKTVFFHCFFVPEALFLEKENSTPWILFVLNGIYSYKVEFTFTSDLSSENIFQKQKPPEAGDASGDDLTNR